MLESVARIHPAPRPTNSSMVLVNGTARMTCPTTTSALEATTGRSRNPVVSSPPAASSATSHPGERARLSKTLYVPSIPQLPDMRRAPTPQPNSETRLDAEREAMSLAIPAAIPKESSAVTFTDDSPRRPNSSICLPEDTEKPWAAAGASAAAPTGRSAKSTSDRPADGSPTSRRTSTAPSLAPLFSSSSACPAAANRSVSSTANTDRNPCFVMSAL